jgi:transposase-like protein
MRGKANTVTCEHKDIRVQNKARDRFQCKDCGKWFGIRTLPNHSKHKKVDDIPKVLLFDLETAPLPALVFNMWNQNIGMHQLQHGAEYFWIITWSAKWLFDNEAMTGGVTPKEALKKDDSRIVRQLWELFDEADIIIAHNAKKFDIKHSNTRFLLNGLQPPSPYLVIDTLLEARKNFYLPHNKLDYIAQIFGIEMKKPTTMQLWTKCLEGDKDSLEYMQSYNDRDVFILEEIYLKIRPWIKSHPNFNLYNGNAGGCSTCKSTNIKRKGWYPTFVNRFEAWQCQDCGSFSRTGKSGKKTDLRSVAR